MQYTTQQIENAKANYNDFIQFRDLEYFNPEQTGWIVAEQRREYHNRIVSRIFNGCQETEREWKLFFLNEEVKSDRKIAESKAKLAANKEASADILAPIKKLRKLGEFGKWLNTSGNEFRKEHFSKKYTERSVDAFLATL